MTPFDRKEELELSDDREATVARWYSHDDQLGFIKVESPNGDIDAIRGSLS